MKLSETHDQKKHTKKQDKDILYKIKNRFFVLFLGIQNPTKIIEENKQLKADNKKLNEILAEQERIKKEKEKIGEKERLTISAINLKEVLGSIQTGIVIIIPKTGSIKAVNNAALDMFGISRDDANSVIGKHYGEFLGIKYLEECLDKPIFESIIKNGTNEIPVSQKGNIIKIIEEWNGKAENYILYNFMDISDIKNSEILLEKSFRKLEQTNRKIEKDKRMMEKILGGVAHDSKNILTTMIGYTELIKTIYEKAKGDEVVFKKEKIEEYVQLVLNNSNSIRELVEAPLVFLKSGAGEIKFNDSPFDINTLLEQSLMGVRYAIKKNEKNINFSKHIDSSVPMYLIGDISRIKQIITNLIGNAFKFTEKGHIKLSLYYVESSNTLQIIVEDSGIGISHENLEKIFEAFHQTDDSYEGFGMGLNIVKNIVHLMSGDINVESEEGKGSKFTVEIKLKKPEKSQKKNTL